MTTGTEVVNIQEEMEKQALTIANRISAPTGDRIRVTQQKTFKMPDGTEQDGPIECVIVDFAAAHYYYTTAYSEGDVTPPDCFALGLNAPELAPSSKALHKQAENCAVCPQNQFGTAPNGKGKACRNTRLLALLPLDATEETPLQLLSLSPTAIKAFDDYAAAIARTYRAPPYKVISMIGFDPTASYATLRFGKPRPNPAYELAFKRLEEARARLLVEPDMTVVDQPDPSTKPRMAPRGAIRGGVKR